MLKIFENDGIVNHFETKIKHKNGKLIDINMNVTHFQNENKDVLLTSIEDITQRIQNEKLIEEKNEEILQQNEEFLSLNEELAEGLEKTRELNEQLRIAKDKAEESDRLKSAFLANVSHEIRTPLNGILGFTKLLKSKIASPYNKKYFDIIDESGQRLMRIIDDILEISQIESKTVYIKKENFNLNEMLKSLYFQINQSNDKKQVNLEMVPNNHNITIYTDKIRLYQIFTNLIDNAFKFTEEGHVKFGYTIEKEYLKFYVKDTGIGIPNDLQDKIFQRFRQVELGYKRKYGGNGLGLSITKSIVELLSGKIWVKSELNNGSEFYFTLPNNDYDNHKLSGNSEVDTHENLDWSSLSVLIVEDEETNFLLLKELLKQKNCKIIHAVNGKEAINCAKENILDLVLMDIKMPVMDGFEATMRIKEIKPKLPIIAVTANASSEDEKKAKIAGCDDFISKPIIINTLYTKVEQLMKNL